MHAALMILGALGLGGIAFAAFVFVGFLVFMWRWARAEDRARRGE